MPSVQLTKPVTQIATVSVSVPNGSAAGTPIAASITPIRGITLSSSAAQFVPTAEYWYITGIYLNPGQTPTNTNSLLLTYVNNVVQPYAPAEQEVQQTTFNKLVQPSSEWVHLPNGQQFQQAVQPQVTATATTTVTFQETILRMPLAALS